MRQTLAESLILGLLGGAAGVLLAYQLADLAGALLPLPLEISFRPGPSVLLAAAGLAVLTSVAVGAVPALQASRRDPAGAMRAARFQPGGSRLRHGLVVAQVALSMMLLAGSFLFARSFWAALSQPVGFATENRLVVQVDLQSLGFDGETGRAFVDQALDRLSRLPGVDGASTMNHVPFRGDWSTDRPVDPADPEGEMVTIFLDAVSPGYFDLLEIPVLRGRPLDDRDSRDAPAAVVVNEALAATFWPGEDAVGRTLPLSEDLHLEVVGVTRDAAYLDLGETAKPQAYFSLDQRFQPYVSFVVHTRGDAVSAIPAVHDGLRGLDANLAFAETTTLAAVLDEETAGFEVSAVLVSAFGLVALLLAAGGLYGVITFLVAQRTREIGVRMALGADRGRVAGAVLAVGGRLALIGIALGLVGALAVRRFTEAMLFQVEPTDPLPLALAAVVLLAVGAMASWAPARRATRIDPLEAMRAE